MQNETLARRKRKACGWKGHWSTGERVIFETLELPGVFLTRPEPHKDERGLFATMWSREEFKAHGLDSDFVQCSVSFNTSKGTLRGMHYQAAPYQAAKLVRCSHGAIYDVVIDLRPESPTFCRHAGVELTAETRSMLYVPRGFAHGFITLAESSEVLYHLTEFFAPEHARGVRWNDPAFGIRWPAEPTVMAPRDREYTDFRKGENAK